MTTVPSLMTWKATPKLPRTNALNQKKRDLLVIAGNKRGRLLTMEKSARLAPHQ